jgi:hypothetical protein
MILSIGNNEFSVDDVGQCSLDAVLFAYYYQAWTCCCLVHLYEIRQFDDTGCIDSGLL